MTRLAPDWLQVRVTEAPDAPAVRARSAAWSRLELLRASDQLAGALLGEGIGPGDRIACLVSDDAPAVALIHGARRLGAVHVPLNRRATPAELRDQLSAVAADVLVCDSTNAPLAQASAPDSVPRHRIEALLAAGPCGPLPVLRNEIELDAPATIIFTSGTSGRAKGAILTHDNHRASAHAWAGLLRPGPGQRWLGCLPLFHVAGLAIITRAARWGAELHLLDAFDAHAVSAALDAGVTHLSLVPAQLDQLLAVREGRPSPDSLRAMLLGGGPVPAALLHRARQAGYPVLTTYGLTETGSGVACGGADQATLDDPTAVRPLAGVEVRVEPDGAADGSGEILVRGSVVFSGYVDDAPASAARLRDGWLHTGDIGTLDADGLLHLVDRRDDLIVSGGENVYPAQVEAILLAHPGIRDAAVVGLPHERWGAVPVAAIVPRADAPDDEELSRYCAEHLARYKIPAHFVRLELLPRNGLGKILRREVRELIEAMPA